MMFTLRFYSTKSGDWELATSGGPRKIVQGFDQISGKVTVPCVELLHEGKVLLRLGLTPKQLMRLAVQGCRLRGATKAFKERYVKLRARGVARVKGGRNELLDAMVL